MAEKRSVRKSADGSRWFGQCPDCHAFVALNDAQWHGQAPMSPHQEWRPSLVHLFAEGRPWILQKATIRARLVFMVLTWADRFVRSTPCGNRSTYDHSQDWPTSGLTWFGPTKQADGWAPELETKPS